jgi:sugar phosphate isomerase/epimerase
MIRILLCLALLMEIVPRGALADDSATTRPAIYVNHAGLSKLGWQLACVGSTFRDRSVFDMIDLLHSMNFHHIELSTGQIDPADVVASDALVAKLKSVHMDIVSVGIVDPGKTESEARTIFELGRRLKIKTIVADPADESLEMLDKLANEYRINVAIVNLAKPGNHWDPDALRGLLAGRSVRVGVCADVAAWRASGISPAQAAKKFAGHVLEVRLGNFDDSDPADVLGELKADKFRGICAVGCLDKPAGDLIDRFTDSINAFSKIVGDLSGLQ